ncbi:MAG: DUF2589 domain-containing protein [Eubacterium sp.]|nr:DUF2589 domain-containing protein [Eubacterium sp.]
MAGYYAPINDLIYAPINAVKEADISLSSEILNQIAVLSDADESNSDSDTMVMKLKKIKFLFDKVKPTELGDTTETVGLTVPTASIVPLAALSISRSVLKFNTEVKPENDLGGKTILVGRTAAKKIRKTDHLPKMHFRIETESADLPEGVSRLLDVLDINQIPNVEKRVYVDSDGVPYKNQALHSAKHKAAVRRTELDRIIEKIKALIEKQDSSISPDEAMAPDMNGKNKELEERLRRYVKEKNEVESTLLDTEMKILEELLKNE